MENVFQGVSENDFYDGAWLLYDELEKQGKIKISIEEKKKLYNEELSKYKAQKKEEIRRNTPNSVIHLLKEFQSKLDSGKPLVLVQNTCKSILVCRYLKKYLKDIETFKQALKK